MNTDTEPASPAEVAGDQVEQASVDLARPEQDYLLWPFDAMNTIAGPLIPGDRPTIIAAYSGQGKTAFTVSCVAEWILRGKRCYIMPLETRAKTWRTTMACMLVGVHPGEVLTGAYLRWKNAAEVKENLLGCIADMGSGDRVDSLYVSDADDVNYASFIRAARHAKDLGMDIMLVDHVDEIVPDDSSSLYEESVKICRGARKIAQETGLRVVLCSQLNNEVAKGSPLARYQPPEIQHLYMGQHKAQVAATVLGLYRPQRRGVDPEQLKRVMSKDAEPASVLEINIMGVVVMKSAHGKTVGARARLWIEHGRVGDLPQSQRIADLGMFHGINTGSRV